MKTMALLASLAFGVGVLTAGAQAFPVNPGASAPSDMLVQVKHKKHKKMKKDKMDQGDNPSEGSSGGKGM